MRSLVPLFTAAIAASAPAVAVEPVPVPAFRAVELHGGGIVTIIPGQAQRVTLLEGSTQFTRVRVDRQGKLEIDACNMRCPRDYHLRVQIETPRIMGLGVNGGGLMTTANGFPRQREIGVAVNGGGKIDARSIDAVTVGAAVNGGGQVLVRSNGTLGAAVHGGGEIVYWGNPTVATSIAGGGAVRKGG
jgi:Putative auto-transporter adhesin, head GIN domain